jgi:hypothetical protein
MAEQFELLGDPTKLTVIPHNCGRGLGPCLVFEEVGQLRCITCGCVGPIKSQRRGSNSTAAFDDFIQVIIRSQLK